jgi:predicted transcriptional regulator
LVGSILGRSSIKNAHLFSIRFQTWPTQAILVSDWSFSKKSSALKPLGQMNLNLVGSIYGGSSMKIAHFVLIRYQTWLPHAILVSDWLISKKSSLLKPLGQMNGKLVGNIYGTSSIKSAHFISICYQTWPPQTIVVSDCLISKKSSFLKPLGQMNRKLVRSIYGTSSIKSAHFVSLRYQTWPPQTIVVSDWLISKKSSMKPLGQMSRNLVGSIF